MMISLLRKFDERLLLYAQDGYLALLDRCGIMKGDALAALVILSVFIGQAGLAAIAFKLVCLFMCLHLSTMQRGAHFAYVNANAERLRNMVSLRLLMAGVSIFHLLREPSLSVVAWQILSFTAVYLWCAKVRKRDDSHRIRWSTLQFASEMR